jgi:hypothetical protein
LPLSFSSVAFPALLVEQFCRKDSECCGGIFRPLPLLLPLGGRWIIATRQCALGFFPSFPGVLKADCGVWAECKRLLLVVKAIGQLPDFAARWRYT